MKWRKFLHLPKTLRRTQSEARSEIGSVKDQSEANPSAPRRSESTPDLQTGTSTLPMSGPSISRDQESSGMQTTLSRPIHLTPLFTQLSGQILSVPGRDQPNIPESSERTVEQGVVSESKSDRKSTAYATTKLAITMAKESSDVFPPLKSVAGGLLAILNHCEVWSASHVSSSPRFLQPSQQTVASRKSIELLIPRVEGLAQSLSGPVPEGEVKEEERRKTLKR